MANLTVDNIVVDAPRALQDLIPAGNRKVAVASVTFGDGVLTYPTGGVPLPSLGHFGFKHQVDFVTPSEPGANGYVYKYDPAAHTLRIFGGGTELVGETATPAAATVKLLMVGV